MEKNKIEIHFFFVVFRVSTGPATENSKDLKVSDLLTSEHSWYIKRIEEELPLLSSQIMALRPSLLDTEDTFI